MSEQDKYKIEYEDDDLNHRYPILVIEELVGLGKITFKKPLKVEILPSDDGNDVLVIYDFGMDYRVPVTKDRNWLYNYAGANEEVDPPQNPVFATVKFDLMHAFFHYNGDPNYGHTHWALRGWLESRVELVDLEEQAFEEYCRQQNEENKLFTPEEMEVKEFNVEGFRTVHLTFHQLKVLILLGDESESSHGLEVFEDKEIISCERLKSYGLSEECNITTPCPIYHLTDSGRKVYNYIKNHNNETNTNPQA